MKTVSLNHVDGSLTVRGTVEQVDIASWIFQTLDRPAGSQSGHLDYLVHGGVDDYAHIVFLAPSAVPDEVREIASAIGIVGDIEKVVAFPVRDAIVLRGTAAQGRLADFLVRQLDQPPGSWPTTGNEHWYSTPRGNDHLVRVFYFNGATTWNQLQDTVTRIRSNAGIERAAIATAARAIVLRGSAGRMDAAERVIMAAQQAVVR
jgi:hypothetical protein